MKKRTLGRTGLEVTELSLGGLFVSSFGAEYEVSRQAVLRALQLGVNYIDTAPTYFDSEEVLGRALEGVDAPFYLSTKIGGRLDPFLPHDPDCLRRSVEESLARLKREPEPFADGDLPGADLQPKWSKSGGSPHGGFILAV